MNIFLTVLEKVLYGTFNDQPKLQNNFGYKCEFNEIFENKIRNIGLSHYLHVRKFFSTYKWHMHDNFDLPQKQNHSLLKNISKIEGLLTKKILEKLNLLPS